MPLTLGLQPFVPQDSGFKIEDSRLPSTLGLQPGQNVRIDVEELCALMADNLAVSASDGKIPDSRFGIFGIQDY